MLGQDVVSKGSTRETSRDYDKIEEKNITSELDFAEWYNCLEHELLDSGHDEYTSAISRHIQRQAC